MTLFEFDPRESVFIRGEFLELYATLLINQQRKSEAVGDAIEGHNRLVRISGQADWAGA